MKINHSVNKSPILGFGEHCKPTTYSHYKTAKIISEIAVALLLTGAVCAVAIVTTPFIPIGFGMSAPMVFGLAASSSVLTISAISSVIYYRKCKNSLFGVLNKFIDKIETPLSLGRSENCSTIPCDDTIESFEWKKKLIQAAEHNIVLSGNYCGGNSFDEILDLIEKQITLKPKLKVLILSSDKFINESNQQKINKLNEQFSENFQLIETPDIYHISPGIKKSTNHSKILAIDYGKYFILGGSGLEDKYAIAKGLGDRGDKESQNVGGLLGWFLPRGFRDQDFVFHSNKKQGLGKRVYIETLKLSLRWQALNNLTTIHPESDLVEEFEQSKDVVKSLLLDELKRKDHKPTQVNTYIKEFHKSPKCSHHSSTKIYCTGPEHIENHFEKELINRFKRAKNRIIIDHMYFHPTQAVLNALKNAAQRGVRIKIITNGYNPHSSPAGHKYFGPRNRYNYCKLRNSLDDFAKKRVSVYEFKVRKTTLHKKVIIADDYVIAGSSNLGYKSLVTMSDHEINFITKSRKFADQIVEVSEIDSMVDSVDTEGNEVKGYARKVNNFDINWFTLFSAAHHRLMAPLIG